MISPILFFLYKYYIKNLTLFRSICFYYKKQALKKIRQNKNSLAMARQRENREHTQIKNKQFITKICISVLEHSVCSRKTGKSIANLKLNTRGWFIPQKKSLLNTNLAPIQGIYIDFLRFYDVRFVTSQSLKSFIHLKYKKNFCELFF